MAVRDPKCLPGCRKTPSYLVCFPASGFYRTEKGLPEMLHPYPSRHIRSCSPTEYVPATWPNGDEFDGTLLSSCQRPSHVAEYTSRVEIRNKRVRLILTALDKNGKQIGSPQKYLFNFKSTGLVRLYVLLLQLEKKVYLFPHFLYRYWESQPTQFSNTILKILLRKATSFQF